jgi:hypothetical protein
VESRDCEITISNARLGIDGTRNNAVEEQKKGNKRKHARPLHVDESTEQVCQKLVASTASLRQGDEKGPAFDKSRRYS